MQDDDVRVLREIDETLKTTAPRLIPRDVLEIACEEKLVKLALEFVRLGKSSDALDVLRWATRLSETEALAHALQRCVRVIQTMRSDAELDAHLAAAEAARRIEALLICDEVSK